MVKARTRPGPAAASSRARARAVRYRPELPTRVDAAPGGDTWLHELSYGGERLGCSKRGARVRIVRADGVDVTERHASLATAVAKLQAKALLLDGTWSDGTYYAFDLLDADGEMTVLPLLERKARLCALLARCEPPLHYCEHVLGDGARVLREACKLGARGLVSKRVDAPHHPGPSQAWLEVACARQTGRGRSHVRISVHGVSISSPERLMYPALGFTKRDLVQFYADISRWVLPHVRGRPLTLVRCEHGASRPDALRSQCQFLRHSEGWHRFVPDSVHREYILEQRKRGEYLVIESEADLLAILNGDILELHTWNATIADIERPNQLVFDLDPGAKVPWPEVRAAAQLLRKRLRARGLASWLKTTGGKGLHVAVPLDASADWDACYAFSHRVARELERELPAKLTTAFGRAARSGKILIDYKRNHRAAVAVAAFSTRARPGGTVSVPIAWDELDALARPDAYTVLNVRERFHERARDPWQEFWKCRQALPESRDVTG